MGPRLEAGRCDHEAAAANLGIYPPLVRVLSFLPCPGSAGKRCNTWSPELVSGREKKYFELARYFNFHLFSCPGSRIFTIYDDDDEDDDEILNTIYIIII